MLHFFLKFLIATLCVIVGLCGLLYICQDRLVFFPRAPVGYEDPSKNPPGLRNPAEYGIPCQDLWITSTDQVVVHAWFLKQINSSNCPTLIFLQGNAGNMGFRLPNLIELYRTLKCNIVAPSYRGYGFSNGKPSEIGMKDDIRSVLQHVTTKNLSLGIDDRRIILFGRSLGGAAAIYLAHQFPGQIQGCIVENTFLSIKDMAKQVFPPLRRLPWLLDKLSRISFDSASLVKDIETPLCFISGLDDTLVPPAHMLSLYALAQKTRLRWLIKVPGGTHNDTWQTCPEVYYTTLSRFVAKIEVPSDLIPNEEQATVLVLKTQSDEHAQSHSSPVQSGLKGRGPRFYEVMSRQVLHPKS